MLEISPSPRIPHYLVSLPRQHPLIVFSYDHDEAGGHEETHSGQILAQGGEMVGVMRENGRVVFDEGNMVLGIFACSFTG